MFGTSPNTIKLTPEDLELATKVAEGRKAYSKLKGRFCHEFKSEKAEKTAMQYEIDGMCGEIAACRFFKVEPDTKVDYDILPNEDLVSNGEGIDVKTTPYYSGKLLVRVDKASHACDVYVLVTGSFPNYRIVGRINKEKVFLKENIKQWQSVMCHTIEQSKLELYS